MERSQLVALALVVSLVIAVAYDIIATIIKSGPLKYYRFKFWFNGLVRVFLGLIVVCIVATVYITLPIVLDFVSELVLRISTIDSAVSLVVPMMVVAVYLIVPIYFVGKLRDFDFLRYSEAELAFVKEEKEKDKVKFNKVIDKAINFFRRIKIGKRSK